jgi:hypothetical protein
MAAHVAWQVDGVPGGLMEARQDMVAADTNRGRFLWPPFAKRPKPCALLAAQRR